MTHSLSEWVSRSPIELSWTAKKTLKSKTNLEICAFFSYFSTLDHDQDCIHCDEKLPCLLFQRKVGKRKNTFQEHVPPHQVDCPVAFRRKSHQNKVKVAIYKKNENLRYFIKYECKGAFSLSNWHLFVWKDPKRLWRSSLLPFQLRRIGSPFQMLAGPTFFCR